MSLFRPFLLALLMLCALSSGSQATDSGVVPTPPTQPLGAGSPSGVPSAEPQVGEILTSSIAPPHDPAAWTRQTFTIASCDAPPKIDGHLDDPCWKTATHAVGFFRYGGGIASPDQTEAWVCADNTHLYFAFHCLDRRPALIQRSMTQRNGNLGNDDFVGIDMIVRAAATAIQHSS